MVPVGPGWSLLVPAGPSSATSLTKFPTSPPVRGRLKFGEDGIAGNAGFVDGVFPGAIYNKFVALNGNPFYPFMVILSGICAPPCAPPRAPLVLPPVLPPGHNKALRAQLPSLYHASLCSLPHERPSASTTLSVVPKATRARSPAHSFKHTHLGPRALR